MATNAVTFDDVVALASQLSPEDRLRLAARIGVESNGTLTASSDEPRPGSAAAVLRAMREPPFPSSEDVDDLERMIAVGKLPVRREGVFDNGDSE